MTVTLVQQVAPNEEYFFKPTMAKMNSQDEFKPRASYLKSAEDTKIIVEEDIKTTRDMIISALKIILLISLVAGFVCIFIFFLGTDSGHKKMVNILESLSAMPTWLSSFAMIGMYSLALVLFCPGTPFNLACGFLFGIWLGFGVAFGGCCLGATCAFGFGRTIARGWVKRKLQHRASFQAVDWAIQKNGVYIVFLTRLSPLFPFPLLNYGFGITKVSLWQYLIGTSAGVFPATIAYTYLGTLMRNLTDMWDSQQSSVGNLIWLIGGAVMTALSIVVISYITKRAIANATKEYEALLSQDNLNVTIDIEKECAELGEISIIDDDEESSPTEETCFKRKSSLL